MLECLSDTNVENAVGIQDFPELGAPTLRGRQHTILLNFPKNCMKLKEFEPPGGRGRGTATGMHLDLRHH